MMYLQSTKHLPDSAVFDVVKPPTKKPICICKMLSPMMTLCKLSGFFPIVWDHSDDGRCTYKKSIFWTCYSVIIICLYVFQVGHSVDFMSLTKIKSLPILLNNITDAIYGVYIAILTAMNLFRYPRWIKTLNRLRDSLKEGIFCQSSMRIVLILQYCFIATVGVVVVIQIGALTFLHFSQTYQTNFDYNIVINKLLQNVSSIFYVAFVTMVAVFIGILACFEKLTISCLKYTPVHPMKGINETNNHRDFFGVVTYSICKESHPCTGKLSKLPQAEIVEFLRILHEDISTIIYEVNNCMNPQFLCHTVVELTVLIVQWYAVIVYMAFEFKAPMASTINVLNCLFVFLHTTGIFLFLKNAQQLKNMIQGLNNFLLEYSTRISSAEEHQQVRLFVEKLKQHRPLTASGVFTIDLGIAGPISANILTYVLVALQFEIPKEE